MSNALDMILTGRPVNAEEALRMGLANRVTPRGTALQSAIELAKQIASFPQACMKADRMSAYKQYDASSIREAIASEFKRGVLVLSDAAKGAAMFAEKKEGRHGSFKDISKL
eukprot:TRINITY_DN5422_c0_g2_i1.p2 TRINITY_DN5422_c0_g2~~TRINITY_DN5422_c0_g2_i1.p2  ORF type:complete len:112 (-),score=18.40 TRINITY_DN5422_c0_g2_i1:41-376(-)